MLDQQRPPVQLRVPSRQQLRQVAIVFALVAAAVAIQRTTSRGQAVYPTWDATGSACPLQGDVLYRGGLALQALQRAGRVTLGLDPEDLLQSALALFERQALQPTHPNTQAMYRLAVIYSQQGYPEEGLNLLARLVQLDETQAAFYLAVSSVYDPKPIPKSELRKAGEIIATRHDWITRAVLPDYYRRLAETQRAREAEAAMVRSHLRFGALMAGLAAIYAALGLYGAALVVRWLLISLFTVPSPRPTRAWPVPWSAWDAVTIAAVLLFAMAVGRLVSDVIITRAKLTQVMPWAAALVLALAYLGYVGITLLATLRCVTATTGRPAQALGLTPGPQRRWLLAGVAGYSVLVALFAAMAVVAHWVGIHQLQGAAPTASDLLEQARGVPEIIVLAVLMCLMAPFLEEVVFRGFIYAGLRRHLQPLLAMMISAVLFSAVHMTLPLGGMAAVGCVGLLLAYLYERHRVLWPSIAAHAVHNALAFTVILVTCA